MASPLAARGPLVAIVAAGDRLVAVGQRGHVVFSDDGGTHWKQGKVPVSVDLTSVYFATPKRGWAVGHDGVVLTSADGGESWTKQLDGRALGRLIVDRYGENARKPGASEAAFTLHDETKRQFGGEPQTPFLDVWFDNENDGYVVGAFNLILKTADGGRSWEPWLDRIDNPRFLHLYAIRRQGEAYYIAGEGGMLWKLGRDASGRPRPHFARLTTPYQGSFFGLVGSGQSLYVFGLRGNLFRTDDGGTHWQKIETGVRASLVGATVQRDGRLLLAVQSGQILVGEDGNSRFAVRQPGNPMSLAGVAEDSRERVVAVGNHGARGLGLQLLSRPQSQ